MLEELQGDLNNNRGMPDEPPGGLNKNRNAPDEPTRNISNYSKVNDSRKILELSSSKPEV